MEFFESLMDTLLAAYGWEGTALAGVLLILLGVQQRIHQRFEKLHSAEISAKIQKNSELF